MASLLLRVSVPQVDGFEGSNADRLGESSCMRIISVRTIECRQALLRLTCFW